MQGDSCPICLDPMEASSLWLSCGHSLHAGCLLETWQDDPLTSWRCPCCRATVVVDRVRPGSELPPEGRGREFFLPPLDLEAGSCGSGGSSDPAGTPSAAPSLAAVCSFVKVAGRALQEQQSGGTSGQCTPGSQPQLPLMSSCSSWVVRTADRLLPQPAAQAAAAALASVRLRQLLSPKAAPSLGLAAALWLNAAALLLGGCALGVVLLRRVLGHAVGGLCRANIRMAGLFGLVPECTPAYRPPPPWLVAITCACSLAVVWEWQHRSGRGWAVRLLLRLDAAAPRLLLQLYLVAFLLAANMLLLALVFNLGAIWAAWLRLGDPPGHVAAWLHPPP